MFVFVSKNLLVKGITLTLIALSCFYCSTPETDMEPENVAGIYELLDFTIVNEENGMPRREDDLQKMTTNFILKEDGRVLGFKLEEGHSIDHWQIREDRLIFEDNLGTLHTFQMELAGDQLTLKKFIGKDGLIANTEVFYTFIKS